MSEAVLVAIIACVGVVVSAVAAALSAVAVKRIEATKTDVGHAREQASKANLAAVEARNYSKPTGNGYADESREAWRRIERQITDLSQRQARTNGWLTRHLSDHAEANMGVRRLAITAEDTDPDDDSGG